MLENDEILAWSLHDLKSADVMAKNNLELIDERSIYHRAKRMAPKYDEIVKEEAWRMLDVGIIVPVSSAWSFPVAMSTKSDGRPYFCVDYTTLN